MANQVLVPIPARYELNFLTPPEPSLWSSLKANIKEALFPEKLPPLHLTSHPVRVKSIWGEYRYTKRSTTMTMLIHAMALSALIVASVIGHKVVKEEARPVIALVAPDLSEYQPIVQQPDNMGGGGVYRVGGGVSPPRVLYNPDPEYTEEARKAKYQGVVVLWLIVGQDGRTKDIRISRSLGMGLDQKAVEAVKLWKFEPAKKDGA